MNWLIFYAAVGAGYALAEVRFMIAAARRDDDDLFIEGLGCAMLFGFGVVMWPALAVADLVRLGRGQ